MHCDMRQDCESEVTHIGEKGYIYCAEHAAQRRVNSERTRKMRKWEISLIKAGKPLPSYSYTRKPKPETIAYSPAVPSQIRSLHIEGRRWFQRGPGNTYHSVRIWINGQQVVCLPFQYGYGEQWLQTALDWLRAEKWIEPGENYGTMYLRETLGGTYSVIDVERKKEL